MRPLASHANLLSEALSGIAEHNYDADDIASYLRLASGIRGVEFNTWEFEPFAGVCETADEYRDDDDKLLSALTHRLSVFLFCWAAIEAYMDILPLVDPPKTPGKNSRQIDRLCFFLSARYNDPLPEQFSELVELFRKLATHAEIGRGAATSTKFPNYMKPAAEGLYLVYEFRNAFSHGDFSVPSPDHDPKRHPDVLVVGAATRIVLLTMQMLTLCHYPHDETVELPSFLSNNEDGDWPTVGETFRNLHMQSFDGIRNES
jgi:hypothetical protein